MAKGSDLLVAALENEGVTQIFGVPGEENLDVVESLRNSKIELVVTRHEQTAAFLAATYGRLTGKPGVCISTLGPGALNLVTGAAYAQLGAMPMVMITGQKGIMSSRQARFQIVDMIATMRPLTKSTQQIVSTATIPTLVREAFRVAMEERPGPVHLELPEDIAGEEGPDVPLVPPHAIDLPVAHPAALDRAAAMILEAKRPLVMLGAGASRPRLAAGLNGFFRRLQLPFFTTQMGKGSVAGGSSLYMGTAALSERDYVHDAIDRADLILAIGHDTIEKPPFIMGPGGPKVIHVGYTPASVEQVYFPDAEVIGDVGPSLALLADRLEGRLPPELPLLPLRQEILARITDRNDDARFPPTPQRIVRDVRKVMPEDGIVALDNGMYKILVRAELPDARRQHAAARQRAGDNGRGPALGDDGGDALSIPPSAGGLRRWRLYDEQPGARDRGPVEAEPRGADPRGQRLRHDPLEAGRRQVSGLWPHLRQSRFRQVRRGLWRQWRPRRGDRRSGPGARRRLQGGWRTSCDGADRLLRECPRPGRRVEGPPAGSGRMSGTTRLREVAVRSPFDGAPVGSVPLAGREAVDRALEVAYSLFRDRRGWLPPVCRIEVLSGVASRMEREAEGLAVLAAREGGKPLVDSRVEVARAIDGVRNCCELLRNESGEVVPMNVNPASAGRIAFTQREPIGVVVALSAFNHPLNLIVHQVAPAIAAGCPVIVKPALATPLSGFRFVAMLHEAGLPEAWCQALALDSNDLAGELAADPRVGFLSFIGSARVGWSLRSKLAPGTRCALEHGGAAPAIVAADADLDHTVPALAKGGFYHAGQVCVSVQRVFAHTSIADRACSPAGRARRCVEGRRSDVAGNRGRPADPCG